MSRLIGLLAGFGLLAGLAAAAGAGPVAVGGPDSAKAAGCNPVTHSKRVTTRKRVRRPGKDRWRRVARVRRWTTCEPLSLAPPPRELPPLEPTPPDRLLVRATDSAGFRFTLSRPDVAAGLVTVQLHNLGEDGHDLHLLEDGTASPEYSIPEVPSGGLGESQFALTAGSWTLYCGLPGHRDAGMEASLTVK